MLFVHSGFPDKCRGEISLQIEIIEREGEKESNEDWKSPILQDSEADSRHESKRQSIARLCAVVKLTRYHCMVFQ
jgi:hypothetical protein